MGSLARVLNLSNEEQRSIESTVGKVRSISEFFADAVEGLKSLDFVEAVQKASPWAEAVGSSLADAIPAVKFVVKLLGRLTGQHDPNALGAVAFTAAYQQAAEQAVRAVGRPFAQTRDAAALLERVRAFDDSIPPEALDFSRVPLEGALQHPFVLYADGMLMTVAEGVGYDERQRREIQNEVHQRFPVHLKTLLSHGDTAEKFAPLRTLLLLGTDERNTTLALMEHAQYQRALYQEAPVFGKEVFSLSHIYVDGECGVIDWGTLRDSGDSNNRRLDPFDETCGGRQRLGETVLDLLADPKFRDAIVIQGVAGAGKSAFTQWLSAELVREGLRPIRILLRDVRLERNRPIGEALAQAIRYRDESDRDAVRYPRPEDPFLKNRIFNERVSFRGASISPYVLILDGWDEISISVPEGFRVRLNRMLEQIRSEYLGDRDVPVRVILTGRPSAEVSDSSFLYASTPILTLRPWRPDDLDAYLRNLATAVNERPLANVEGTGWPHVDIRRFEGAIERYREEFVVGPDAAGHSEHTYAGSGSTVEILGMPLLAFLAGRLLAEVTDEDAAAALDSPTTLFRSLLDLTCGGAGKYGEAREQIDHQFRYHGNELRKLLRNTAAAMTVNGKENISYSELELRLRQEGLDVRRKVEDETSDNPLSQLIVSYYFKGGHTDLGCEFLHKSFREYLFAEEIVEVLKEFGRAHAGKELPKREPYWQDFRATDPQYSLSRALANRLGAQWITYEVWRFISDLLVWEIGRKPAVPDEQSLVGRPTQVLSMAAWETIRDALADLWEWWGEGVHMRPQPIVTGRLAFGPPLAHEVVVDRVMPLDLDPRQLPAPPRLTMIDAHLGDALFRLSSVLHFQIASQTGWLDFGGEPPKPDEMWNVDQPRVPHRRQYQTIVSRGGRAWTLFCPGGQHEAYWGFYSARINAAGWRTEGAFPLGCDARGLDLARSIIIGISVWGETVNWAFSNLSGCEMSGPFARHRFDFICARRLVASYGVFLRATFTGAWMRDASFDAASLERANFRSAFLKGSVFSSADMTGADFSGAALDEVGFAEGVLRGAIFTDVKGVPFLHGALIDSRTVLPPRYIGEPVTVPD